MKHLTLALSREKAAILEELVYAAKMQHDQTQLGYQMLCELLVDIERLLGRVTR